MRKFIKLVSLILVIALCSAVLFTGCGSENNATKDSTSAQASSTPSDTTAKETSEAPKLEKVEIRGVLLGDEQPDGPMVMEEVNKKLEKDINATIKLQYIAFGDMNTKYPLVLASGQDWDFIYGNVNYAANAAKGGYHEIKMEDIEKNMPLTFKATLKEQWADTLVDGKIYMIPQTFKELDVGSYFYREDLRKKYNIPEIKTAADLAVYMETLKKNGVSPLDGGNGALTTLFRIFLYQYTGYERTKFPNAGDASGDLVNFSADDSASLKGLLDAEFVTAFKKAAYDMKALYDKGLLPKNAFAQKTNQIDLFKAGKTTMICNAFENYPQYESDAKSKGWELGCFPILAASGSSLVRPATGNGFSLSPVSKNYERTLMAIDLLHQDKSYNMLISFGIEGKHYDIKDGKLSLGVSIDPAKHPYRMYQSGWWSNNRNQWPPIENYSQNYIDMKKRLQDAAKPNKVNGFNANTESIKTEIANVLNVATQYELPIMMGMVKNPDAAVDALIEKLKSAGAQKVVDEFNKQLAEFVKAHSN